MIHLAGLTKTVREPDGTERVLLDAVDLQVDGPGRSVAILGRSGSGKSTLLRILAGLDLGWSGTYLFDGHELERDAASMARHRRRHVGMVAQGYDLLDDRPVVANVRMGVLERAGRTDRARECLRLVGLEGYERRAPSRLSGGEAQRVAVARAIAKNPTVVLADEPTGALDAGTETAVLELFAELQRRGTTLVVATHSERVAATCDRRLVIRSRTLHET